MHACEFSKVGFCDVYIERLALVDKGPTVCRHVDQRALRYLPDSLVYDLQVVRDLFDLLKKGRKEMGVDNNATINILVVFDTSLQVHTVHVKKGIIFLYKGFC